MKISLKKVSFYGFEANRLIHTLYFCSVKHISTNISVNLY